MILHDAAGPAVLAWRREDDHERVLAAVNFAPEALPLGLEPDEGAEATLLLSSDPDRLRVAQWRWPLRLFAPLQFARRRWLRH